MIMLDKVAHLIWLGIHVIIKILFYVEIKDADWQ